MPGRKRARESQAAAEERAMKRIDRAVKRYGTSAVAKYYSPASSFKPEVKYFDCQFDHTDDGAATAPGTANVILMQTYVNADGSTVSAYTGAALIPSAIGNGYGQVIGNKYLIKKLKVRGSIIRPASGASTPGPAAGLVRILLVQDTQPNGAQFDPAGMFTDFGTVDKFINSFQAIASGSGGRIRILADKFIPMDPVGITADTTLKSAGSSRQFSFTKTWKKGLKVVVKSGASTPAVASLSDMNIFMVAFVRDSNVSSDYHITGVSRCAYVD